MSSLICADCGHANGTSARFCEECGGSLAPRCPSCGASVSPTARFCAGCGAPLADAAPTTGALKVVSVLFSDVVGSTALQEALEPESARRVMTRFYEAMRAVVERHDGAIQKFIGDAVVAVFGVPTVYEDDAVRAVRCATAMTAALASLNDELERTWGVRIEMRTGVNSGELAISAEGIFVGDTMNTAARLEQAAAPGQVLLGEATWRLVRHEVEVEELTPLSLKGKAAPVRVWRVVSTEPRSAAAAEAPLVGRAGELERLRAGLADAIAARSCRLVTVIGSPGLGKSRLAGEFARSAADGAVVLHGHCEASGEGITFLPVADVLRGAASINETDTPGQVVEKLTAVVTDDADRERAVARVAGLLGAAVPAAPEETFWGVRTVLESLARERPLVIVLDDVHWGQPMFLDLIEHLVEWVRDAPILLVALARPELRETREALAAAGRRPVDVIELQPLEADQSRELVGGLLGQVDLPDDLLGRILATTEGNPLFLGELLRMLVEEGSLARDDQAWVAADGADVQVPPTIQALLTARIERLRADERAAVIGKQFYRGAVAELLAPPARPAIDGHLEALRRKDMVEPEGTYWIDEPVYRFHHVLLRDAAYHLLLKEARAELHEKFADWLETKAGELVGEHEEVIAYHLEQAHEYRRLLGPLDERGRALGSRAAGRLASAGRRALAREDLAAAANLLRRALDRDAGDGEQAVLWDLGEALLSAGDTTAAAAVADRLECPRRDVMQAQLAVLTGAAALEPTLERVTAATDALMSAGDAAAEAKGHHVAAQVQAQLGRVADVEASLDRALLAARKAQDRRRITAVLAAAPRAALWGPSPVVRASGRCLDVVRILRMTPGNRHVEAVALRCQAVLEAMRGREGAAREILAGGRATLEELGLALELHELTMHAGIVELLAGQARDAEELLRSARDGFAALGVSVSAAQSGALLARALVEQGRDAEAIAETEHAERHAGGDLKTTITSLGVRAEALARGGEIDAALALAGRAVSLGEPTDALADKADAMMVLARVSAIAGRADEARAAAASARALYEAKHHAVGVQRADELASGTAPARSAGDRQSLRVVRRALGQDELDQILATDGRVVVGRTTVSLVEDGRLVSVDHYEPGDQKAMIARYAELGGGAGPLGDLPPERFFKHWLRLTAAVELEALADLVAEDFIRIDHRSLNWEPIRGREANLVLWRSANEGVVHLRMEAEEVLACDERVIAWRFSWRGAATGGPGEFAVGVGQVNVVEDGVWLSCDQYEPDDREAMLARFAELAGERSVAGGDRPSERLLAQLNDELNARNYERLPELVADDWYFVDHRALGWEEAHGRDQCLAIMRSAFEASPGLRIEYDEILACDEHVIVAIDAWRGEGVKAGELEVTAGVVHLVEDGRWAGVDFYEPADRAAMIARYAELGGGSGLLGDSPIEQLSKRWVRAYGTRDLDRLSEFVDDDWVLIDHRGLGWPELRGREAWLEGARAAYAAAADIRVEIEEVLACDDHVMALILSWRGTSLPDVGGGPFELTVGHVTLVEDGRFVRVDQYEPGDRAAMLGRYAELGGTEPAAGERPPERWWKEFGRRFAAGDMDAMRGMYAEDAWLVDHRPFGILGELHGGDSVFEIARSSRAAGPGVRHEIDEVLACDDRVIALRSAFRGRGIKAGAFSAAWGLVTVVEGGRLVSIDVYETDDREGVLKRYAELSTPPAT